MTRPKPKGRASGVKPVRTPRWRKKQLDIANAIYEAYGVKFDEITVFEFEAILDTAGYEIVRITEDSPRDQK